MPVAEQPSIKLKSIDARHTSRRGPGGTRQYCNCNIAYKRLSRGDSDHASPPPLKRGDTVQWNGQYKGRVETVNSETALVVERDDWAFGRTIKCRLQLDALVRIGDRTDAQ